MWVIIWFQKNGETPAKLNTEQRAAASYHHQNKGEAEAFTKLVKQTMKRFGTNPDVHIAVWGD